MNITFRQLQIFKSVAKNLSVTHAAEELFLSQPAVSMQLKQLENAVQTPLYEQLGKKIFLTEAGCLMQQFSEDIHQKLSEMSRDIDALKGIEGGLLNISVATTVNYYVAQVLSKFYQQHKRLRINLDVTNRANLLSKLEKNETDLVLMGPVPKGLDVVSEPFMNNPLVIIAPPSHPLVNEKRIPLRKLKNDTLLMREVGSGTRMEMEHFFLEKKNFKLISTIEMNSNEAIKQSVEAGLGLGIVSEHTIQLEKEVGRLNVLDVINFPIIQEWNIVYRKGKQLSVAANAFREFILNL